MKKFIVFFVIVMMPFSASAQVETDVLSKNIEPPKVEETNIYDKVDQMPSFPGGQRALMSWIYSNLKYPVAAEENGVQGKVVCSFVVERDGSITDVRAVRGVDPSLDREALRVLKQLPHWIPGKKNGSVVRVRINVPVTFSLQ